MNWSDEYIDKVICDDNLNVMAQMPDECVDLILTDPPYGIAFMSKNWDKAVPPVDVWRECLRVLKPGAFAFIMCIPRQDCQAQMVVNLKEAGFDVSHSPIYHCFAQGFPKAANVSKMVDARLGMEREVVGRYMWPNPAKASVKNSTNPNPMDWGKKTGEERLSITTPASPEAIALDGAYSGYQPKPAVEVVLVCQRPFNTKHRRSDVYRILGGRYDYWYTQHTEVTEPKGEHKGNIDKLSKKYAKELQGAGYTLKDGDVIERRLALRDDLSDEVIVNRKVLLWSAPYKDTDITSSITHALDSGRGVTFLDDCRIPYESEEDKVRNFSGSDKASTQIFGNCDDGGPRIAHDNGRFPANILVSDDVLNDGVERKTGNIKPHKAQNSTFLACDSVNVSFSGDSGSYSRYFDLDVWAQEHLPESVLKTFPFLLVPKASKSEQTAGGRVENKHPTVKAIKLIAYLITMGSRPGDVILDPYLGSGTTAVACVLKQRHYVGCELDQQWCDIAEKRIEYARQEMKKESRKQLELFQ